jgi:O-antigen ligase
VTVDLARASFHRSVAEIGTAAMAILLVLLAVLGSRLSLTWFLAPTLLLVLLVAGASLVWPRQILVVVVLSPIVDRYVVPGLLTPEAESLAHLLSEALLVAVGLALVAQAASRGTLRAGFAHPLVPFLAVFVIAGIASALLSGVPVAQAIAGIGFTLDAVALFFLARIVGYGARDSLMAIGAFVSLLVLAAAVAVGQALLSPHILGLSVLQGRFGEPYRLASFFGDPNVFAAFLSAAIPILLFATTGLRTPRGRRIALAAAALLLLGLWLSFSRGGWVGAIGGFMVAALLLDRRVLRIGLAVGVSAFVVALVMPRDLLVKDPVVTAQRPDLFRATIGRVGAVGQGKDLRTLLILNAVPIVEDHPLLGVGPGMYGGAAADIFGTPIYREYGTDRLLVNPAQRTVDDFWLHLLVESGFVGLLAFLAMVGSALAPIIMAARHAAWERRVALCGIVGAALCILVNSLSTMLLEANSVAYLFWFLLGLGSILAATPTAEAEIS